MRSILRSSPSSVMPLTTISPFSCSSRRLSSRMVVDLPDSDGPLEMSWFSPAPLQ
ncbi:Uncharacterised protein [Bordetella pertussis]|nr:Uncharacterised protein [Bordetella pertussis]